MSTLNKNLNEIWASKYVVPLYQRNYAWQEPQIQRLLQDIYDNFKHDPQGRYYIGSLVVLQRADGVYEIIDGQQRLTTLQIICKVLDLIKEPRLSFDSRPEVEVFFNDLFHRCPDKNGQYMLPSADNNKTFRLIDAVDLVLNTHVLVNPASVMDEYITLFSMTEKERSAFKDYIANNVVLVRTLLPGDTDVAAYFEIMNNRGEQLKEHEIVKSLMLRSLNKAERKFYSDIWDACSQMDIPIQRTLKKYRNDANSPMFGAYYGELHVGVPAIENGSDSISTMFTIDQILEETFKAETGSTSTDEDQEIVYESIIDFPNFLMHIFKLLNEDAQLNPDYLLDTYHEYESKIDPGKFMETLLKARTLFDRYVIKAQGEGEEDENLKWRLLKPYKSGSGLKFRNTFTNRIDDADEDEIDEPLQRRIIMQQSMLQVTFRNRKYKNWLFDLLKWLIVKDVDSVAGKDMSVFLDRWMLNYYDQLSRSYQDKQNDYNQWAFEALGTNTPHFIFNLIDYLYWVLAISGKPCEISYLNEVKDFFFRYYNSVEHHLPYSYENTEGLNADTLGNLCLISRRKNSSLNDKAPKEKAKIEAGMQPKRKIMYQMTIDADGQWGKDQIQSHMKDIRKLLDSRSQILTS